jgi:hypothetical protein
LSDITPQNITALSILLVLAKTNRQFERRGDNLFVSQRATLPPEMIEAIRLRKDELLALAPRVPA